MAVTNGAMERKRLSTIVKPLLIITGTNVAHANPKERSAFAGTIMLGSKERQSLLVIRESFLCFAFKTVVQAKR